jgi:hypothetical protein
MGPDRKLLSKKYPQVNNPNSEERGGRMMRFAKKYNMIL